MLTPPPPLPRGLMRDEQERPELKAYLNLDAAINVYERGREIEKSSQKRTERK
jgi:hypothetical protein